MVYILLCFGILLIIYGSIGINQKTGNDEYKEKEASSQEFNDIFNERLILERLDIVEQKIDKITDTIEGFKTSFAEKKEAIDNELNKKSKDIDDINLKIFSMKDQGMSIEEISKQLGLLKGEVLLRLGMKR